MIYSYLLNKKPEIEIRSTNSEVVISKISEQRAGDGRHVEGYALLFNTPSDGLSFEEIILPGALDGVIERSNVFALLNHDSQRGILARSKFGIGTLKLQVDEIGLKYSFDAPKTALGDELLEHLRRGNINESSFAFTVADEAWGKDGGKVVRKIKKIDQLFDVSPVYDAAYSKTSVSTGTRAEAEMKEALELERYYQNLNKYLN